MNRRDFLRTAGGTAGTAAALTASGSATAASEGGGGGEGGGGAKPDVGGFLQGANNYDGEIVDARGQDEVTIDVGAGDGLSFGPAAVWVDVGTTIIWEWTGNGGAHNVISDNVSAVDSGSPVGDTGTTYEFTAESSQIIEYYCSPHQSSGMLGAVAVGEDVPMVQPNQGPGTPTLHEAGVDIQEHFVGVAVMLAMSITTIFTFFTLKYGESSHTKGGN